MREKPGPARAWTWPPSWFAATKNRTPPVLACVAWAWTASATARTDARLAGVCSVNQTDPRWSLRIASAVTVSSRSPARPTRKSWPTRWGPVRAANTRSAQAAAGDAAAVAAGGAAGLASGAGAGPQAGATDSSSQSPGSAPRAREPATIAQRGSPRAGFRHQRVPWPNAAGGRLLRRRRDAGRRDRVVGLVGGPAGGPPSHLLRRDGHGGGERRRRPPAHREASRPP